MAGAPTIAITITNPEVLSALERACLIVGRLADRHPESLEHQLLVEEMRTVAREIKFLPEGKA